MDVLYILSGFLVGTVVGVTGVGGGSLMTPLLVLFFGIASARIAVFNTNGRATGTYRSGEQLAMRSIVSSISRADVADFMLRQLAEDRYILHSPSIMN